MKLQLVISLSLALLFVAGCGGGGGTPAPQEEPETFTVDVGDPPPTPPPAPPPVDTLAMNRTRWTDAGIMHYKYTCIRVALAPPALTAPVVVEVLNGLVISRKYEATGQPAPGVNPTWWPSLNGLFDIVSTGYANGDDVFVQYHATLGFPVFANIDPDPGIGDDEISFNASGFTILP